MTTGDEWSIELARQAPFAFIVALALLLVIRNFLSAMRVVAAESAAERSAAATERKEMQERFLAFLGTAQAESDKRDEDMKRVIEQNTGVMYDARYALERNTGALTAFAAAQSAPACVVKE